MAISIFLLPSTRSLWFTFLSCWATRACLEYTTTLTQLMCGFLLFYYHHPFMPCISYVHTHIYTGWKARQSPYHSEEVEKMSIIAPVKQEAMGRMGCYALVIATSVLVYVSVCVCVCVCVCCVCVCVCVARMKQEEHGTLCSGNFGGLDIFMCVCTYMHTCIRSS